MEDWKLTAGIRIQLMITSFSGENSEEVYVMQVCVQSCLTLQYRGSICF